MTMREYAWYSPEIDVITIQVFIGNHSCFEWDWRDISHHLNYPHIKWDNFYWIPLGEI